MRTALSVVKQRDRYSVIGRPLLAGGVKGNAIPCWSARRCSTAGGPGAPTVARAGDEAALVPLAVVWVTVQRYVLPVVNPGTLTGERVPARDPSSPPLSDRQVARYEVTLLPFAGPTLNDTIS